MHTTATPLPEANSLAVHVANLIEHKKVVPLDQQYIGPLRSGHSVLPPQLLRTSIFAISAKGSAACKALSPADDVSDYSKGGAVEYKGAPLLQADLRVLLGLLKRGAGLFADNAVLELDAVEFLESIGKSTCSRSIEALRDSLTSLRSATFVVKDFARDRGHTFSFIDKVEWNRRTVTIKLSGQASWALSCLGRTYIDLSKRNQLKDGVQTALADLLRSTSVESLDINDLAKLWGREPKETGRDVREALDRLVEVGLVTSWERARGRVRVVRAQA